MRCTILAFVGGAALLQQAAALPDPGTILKLAFAAMLLALLRRLATSVLAGLLTGFCWAALLAQIALAPQLASEDEGRDLVLTGTIDSLPYQFEQGVRFNLAVESATGAAGQVPPRIALAWYSAYRDARQAIGEVRPGERWRFTVRLQRPHGNANPYVSVSWS